MFPELPLDMSVTEGSDYGNLQIKQELPDSDTDTVKCEGLPSGSETAADSETMKCEMLPSGSRFGADSDKVKCEMLPSGSEPGADNETGKCEMLPSGSQSGAVDQSRPGTDYQITVQFLECHAPDIPILSNYCSA